MSLRGAVRWRRSNTCTPGTDQPGRCACKCLQLDGDCFAPTGLAMTFLGEFMNRNLSRRDFLKIAGTGLSALAFKPYSVLNLEYLSFPKRLPDFPKSEIIGRTVDPGIDLRSSPTNDPNVNNSITKVGADTLVEWGRQVIGNVIGGLTNQRYVETPQGYIYASVLQPTRNLPNTTIAEMPVGQQGFWAEVTVPYVDLAHEGVVASPWLQDHIAYNFPPRLYYGQVVWIDQIRTA